MKEKHIFYLLCFSLILYTISCAPAKLGDDTQEQPPKNGQAGTFEDGVYSAEEAGFDEHGWKPMATVVVENGKVSKAYYDEVNEEGQLKSFDQDYLERWKEKTGENLLNAEPELVNELTEKQNPDQISYYLIKLSRFDRSIKMFT